MAENNGQEMPQLEIGDLVQIDITDNKHVSTHVEYLQDATIWVSDIFSEIWNYKWRRLAFDAYFIRGDRCFSFLTEIEGKDKMEGLVLTRMMRISQVQEAQRRASYRLPYAYDVYLRRRWSEDTPYAEQKYTCCNGIDISETGIGLTTEGARWKPGDVVQCRFVVDGEEFVFDATVMRRVAWTKDNLYVYRLGVRFHTDDEKQLRNIRRFVFKQQVARMI